MKRLKNLYFEKAAYSTSPVLKKGTYSEVKNESGNVISIIGGEYENRLDKYDYTSLRVYEKDMPDVYDALQFACTNEINFPLVVLSKGKVWEIEIPGHFTVLLDEGLIEILVKGYHLFKDHYISFQNLFDDIKFTEKCVYELLHQRAIPAWMLYAAELRKEN